MAYNIPEELRYSEHDEWVRVEGDEIVIGITDYAQSALGDIVYIELPQVGDSFEPSAVFGVIESVKASSELYMPVGGEVIAVNSDLEGDQSPINGDPYGAGWMLRIKPSGAEGTLMDATAYQASVEERDH